MLCPLITLEAAGQPPGSIGGEQSQTAPLATQMPGSVFWDCSTAERSPEKSTFLCWSFHNIDQPWSGLRHLAECACLDRPLLSGLRLL